MSGTESIGDLLDQLSSAAFMAGLYRQQEWIALKVGLAGEDEKSRADKQCADVKLLRNAINQRLKELTP